MAVKVIAILVDIVLSYATFILAFWLRFYSRGGAWTDSFRNNSGVLPFLVIICIGSLIIRGSYPERFKSYYGALRTALSGLGLAMFAGMSFVYVFRSRWLTFPSGIFLIAFPLMFLAVATGRILIYQLFGKIFRTTVFIGEKEAKNPDSLLNHKCDDMVIASNHLDTDAIYRLLRISDIKKVKLSILPELYEEIILRKIKGDEELLHVLPAYFKNNAEDLLLRKIDIVIGTLLLFFSLPVTLLIAFCIKIDSPGSVIYRQKRVGKDGKIFMLYKFRSMIENAPQYSRSQEMHLNEDERVTLFGRLLRKSRLDELPQLFNVLKGDMSLVGPRPEAIYRVEAHPSLQSIRLSVRPGLTGLAQIVEGSYHINPRNKLRYDYIYIRNRSLGLNLNILAKTIMAILRKPGS